MVTGPIWPGSDGGSCQVMLALLFLPRVLSPLRHVWTLRVFALRADAPPPPSNCDPYVSLNEAKVAGRRRWRLSRSR